MRDCSLKIGKEILYAKQECSYLKKQLQILF